METHLYLGVIGSCRLTVNQDIPNKEKRATEQEYMGYMDHFELLKDPECLEERERSFDSTLS